VRCAGLRGILVDWCLSVPEAHSESVRHTSGELRGGSRDRTQTKAGNCAWIIKMLKPHLSDSSSRLWLCPGHHRSIPSRARTAFPDIPSANQTRYGSQTHGIIIGGSARQKSSHYLQLLRGIHKEHIPFFAKDLSIFGIAPSKFARTPAATAPMTQSTDILS
jgi:hypothetical protein